MTGRLRRPILGAGTIMSLLALWEALARNGVVPEAFAVAPSQIAVELKAFAFEPEFWRTHVAATGRGLAAGWLLAVAVGLVVGFLMGWYGWLRDTLEPALLAFYSMPRMALIPLFTIWFGFGFQYKVVIVFLAAVFPVLMNAIGGVRNADEQLVRMARSYGASDLQVMLRVVLPGAVPFVVTGLRLALISAITGVVAGEIFSSNEGLGYVIARAGQLEQIDRLFAAVAILAAAGAVLNEALLAIERRFQRWRPDKGGR